ncbi:hypothetical protein HYV49_03425 [Candidatus Pacearchaeota archaeon]|nr:hypothetical protein [Candidatus Pacearchaeota archaeon]
MINNQTKIFFSISSNPGNFGAYLYNKAFQELNIDAIYKPLKLDSKYQLTDFINLLSVFKIIGTSGLSVSMPFKRYAYLAIRSEDAATEEIGNANTIVFDEHTSYCYNVDHIGFEKSCYDRLYQQDILDESKSAIIFGKGSVANSIAYVLKSRNIDFFMTKDPENLINRGIDFLINATPVGMDHIQDDVFNKKIVKDYKFVFDVVVKKETNLIKLARELNKTYVCGWQMASKQLTEQFKIYTKKEYPEDLMNIGLKELGYGY